MQAQEDSLKHKYLKRIVIVTIALAVLACAPSAISAQSFRGSIRGQILDASGASIVGADVTAKNVAMGQTRAVQSDAQGAI